MNITEPFSLHRLDIEINNFLMLRNLYVVFTFSSSWGMLSVPECVAYMVVSSGKATIGPFDIGCSSCNSILIAM